MCWTAQTRLTPTKDFSPKINLISPYPQSILYRSHLTPVNNIEAREKKENLFVFFENEINFYRIYM